MGGDDEYQGAGRVLRTEDVVAIEWSDGADDVDTEADVLALATRASHVRSRIDEHLLEDSRT